MKEEIIDGYLINGVNVNIIICLVAALAFSIGLYCIVAEIMHLPGAKMIKAARHFGERGTNKRKWLEEHLEGYAISLSKKIKLNDYKRAQLKKDLEAAGINRTPEEYVSAAVVKSVFVTLLSVPFFFFFQVVGFVIIAMAFCIYRGEITKVKSKVEDRRSAIEEELPRLTANIEKMLMHSRDVLSMLEGYCGIAGPELKKELQTTVADMRTGNYEIALSRLESRVGSSYMSDVTRGLISVLRGDDTGAYWAMLSIKFADYQRTLLKAKAAKVPHKVRRLSVSLLFCFLMIYVVVIGTSLVNSLGSIF